MSNWKKLLCCFIVFFVTSCQISNNNTKESKVQESNTKNLSTLLYEKFDAINDFYQLSDDELLIFGTKNQSITLGKYNFADNTIKMAEEPIQYSTNFSTIGIIEQGFYIANLDKVTLFDFDLNISKTIDMPNLENIPFSTINPVCFNKKGDVIYYTVENNDFTNSVVEKNLNDGKTKVIYTYSQNASNTIASIVQLFELSNNTIGYLGATYTSTDNPAISSFGIIDKNNGLQQNIVLDTIQYKSGNNSFMITDDDNPLDINANKGYIYLYENQKFQKLNIHGAKHVKPCKDDVFISHDTDLDYNTNIYTTYKTYIYKNKKVIKEFDDANKFEYSDYITDFYMEKYNVYIQAIFSESDMKSTYNIIDL